MIGRRRTQATPGPTIDRRGQLPIVVTAGFFATPAVFTHRPVPNMGTGERPPHATACRTTDLSGNLLASSRDTHTQRPAFHQVKLFVGASQRPHHSTLPTRCHRPGRRRRYRPLPRRRPGRPPRSRRPPPVPSNRGRCRIGLRLGVRPKVLARRLALGYSAIGDTVHTLVTWPAPTVHGDIPGTRPRSTSPRGRSRLASRATVGGTISKELGNDLRNPRRRLVRATREHPVAEREFLGLLSAGQPRGC
jgi:hypothetical protein